MLSKNKASAMFSFIDLHFDASVSLSSCNRPEDKGTIAVVNHNTLNLTHFQKAVLPPPMFQFSLLIKQISTISYTTFSQNYIICRSHNIFIRIPNQPDQINNYQIMEILHEIVQDYFNLKNAFIYIQNHETCDFDIIIVCEDIIGTDKDNLIEIKVEKQGFTLVDFKKFEIDKISCIFPNAFLTYEGRQASSDEEGKSTNSYYFSNQIVNLFEKEEEKENKIYIFVLSLEGKLFKFYPSFISNGLTEEAAIEKHWLNYEHKLHPSLKSTFINGKESIIGLARNNKLFINDKLFCTGCISFALYLNFLMFVKSAEKNYLFYIYDLNRALPFTASVCYDSNLNMNRKKIHPFLHNLAVMIIM